jgi:hypothetical protein
MRDGGEREREREREREGAADAVTALPSSLPIHLSASC